MLATATHDDVRTAVDPVPFDCRADWPDERLAQTATCRRVLFVSYPFPPVGGAGVQRVAKFVKYLPEFDWQSSVLTVANPSVPAYDHSLVADIPRATIIRKARTWEPGYALKAAVAGGGQAPFWRQLVKGAGRRLSAALLQPDPQVLWLPDAVREGRRLLRAVPHAAIVASGPPFSTFLLGALLQQVSGLPLVLDYRDEWGLSNRYLENKQAGPVTRFIHARMQRHALRRAAAVVATTRASAGALQAVCAEAGAAAPVRWIYNGFDAADFPHASGAPARNPRYRLVYVGTLWNLTSVAPLVAAVTRLSADAPELAGQLEIVIAGRRTAPQQELLQPLRSLPCRLVEHPYLDHDAALELVRSADGLCVLLADVGGAERVVPAKLFEYMATRRPILALVPPGECRDLLKDYPAALPVAPGDVAGIANVLAGELRRHATGRTDHVSWNGARFERRSQAGELARLLDALTDDDSCAA